MLYAERIDYSFTKCNLNSKHVSRSFTYLCALIVLLGIAVTYELFAKSMTLHKPAYLC